ncbi:MAG: hypothetical protein ACREP5_06485, partial [Candidatus Binatia bacterium]
MRLNLFGLRQSTLCAFCALCGKLSFSTDFLEEYSPIATEHLHTYCAMCISRCGVIATVDDGRLTGVNADPDHPNGCICVKGTAAPEIVY